MANPLITHVVWTLGRGGAERMVFDLARRLPEQGFDARILAAGGGGEMEHQIREAGIPLSINLHGGGGPAALAFLREEIRNERPAIWHTHLTPVWGGLAALTRGFRPWIATVHGFEQGALSPKTLARRFAYRFADHVVCVSEALRDDLDFLKPDHVSVIPPGIDLSRFTPREPSLASDVPELLTVSRLVPEKGIDVLLEALARVLRPWRLTIVGDGPEAAALHHKAEWLGLAPRVRFIGAVADPSYFYRNADLFCLPSLTEGQGMSLLEAAACRLPAISSDLPAVREAFGGQAVTLAQPGDADSWRRAIERVLAQYEEALARADHASRVVRERYSLDALVRAHAALYRKSI